MRAGALAALVALAGCGRVGFGSRVAEDAALRDALVDAALDASGDAAPVDPIGCSDGERDDLSDLTAFPTIAACSGTWAGSADLRAPSTGLVCGDESGACNVPADLCSAGWHVCGKSGSTTELLALSAADCLGLGARFVAAVSHCVGMAPAACGYPNQGEWPCASGDGPDCIQPVCCGSGCDTTVGCPNGVWPGQTEATGPAGPGCANLPSTHADGVLCCKG